MCSLERTVVVECGIAVQGSVRIPTKVFASVEFSRPGGYFISSFCKL